MAKKEAKERKPFNFGNSTLVKTTEQTVTSGYERIEQQEQADRQEQTTKTAPAMSAQPETSVSSVDVPQQQNPPSPPVQQTQVYRTARLYHKERTQDILIHCPQSLHRRMTDLKNHLWDEYGERVTINNMTVEAIALWLDQKAPLTPASDAGSQVSQVSATT